MKLNVWLKQQHPLGERLRVVERLAQTLNEHHDRGEPLAALDPEHLSVEDGECDISGARRGNPAQSYSAPERSEGGAASIEADIYAAGAIAWEVLAGRPYAASPSHLAEAASDVPRELADAVMACLEQSPQWRPRDLTYVAQLAAHAQGSAAKADRPARTAPAARPTQPRAAAAPLRSLGTPREARSPLPLVMTATLVVVAAGGGYYWFSRERPTTPTATVPPAPQATPPTALNVTAQATSPALPSPASPPVTVAPVSTPAPASTATPPPMSPVATMPRPTPLPAATTRPIATPPPATPPPTRTVAVSQPPDLPRSTPPPLPSTTTTTTTLAPAVSIPREPPVLSAVSPLSVRRPGKVILDLHGSGLRADLRARILPLKEPPRGISIARQVSKNSGLMQLLLDLDSTVAPGAYAVALEDAAGGRTQALTFTVTK